MKERMRSLLFELLRDSKRSDRELAKVIGVSQPTITRMRSRLVEEGVIKEFTVIPDFVKMGYEIMAISCVRVKSTILSKLLEKAGKWMMEYPNVIFVSKAQGMGKNGVAISFHKNYTDYTNFLAKGLEEWGDDVEEYDSMLISLEGRIAKTLSLSYLADQKET